jgi:hypothetical protein
VATLTVTSTGTVNMTGYSALNLNGTGEITATLDTSTLVQGQSYLIQNLSAARAFLALSNGGLVGPSNFIAQQGATKFSLSSWGASGGLNSVGWSSGGTWNGTDFVF